MAAPKKVDYEAIDWAEICSRELGPPTVPACGRGVEADLVRHFCDMIATGYESEGVVFTQADKVVTELALKFGRADIVVFHVDGTATVIEAKDGRTGFSHVIGGIGQASLYAAQLSLSKSGLRKVRRALLWSTTGNIKLDTMIDEACRSSGTVPLIMADVQDLMILEAMQGLFRSDPAEFVKWMRWAAEERKAMAQAAGVAQ